MYFLLFFFFTFTFLYLGIFPNFGCVSRSSVTIEMWSLVVSFVIIFSISMRFFTSLISLFNCSCFFFCIFLFLFLFHMHKLIVLVFVLLHWLHWKRKFFLCILCLLFFLFSRFHIPVSMQDVHLCSWKDFDISILHDLMMHILRLLGIYCIFLYDFYILGIFGI